MRMTDSPTIEEVDTLVSIWFWVDTKYANPPPIPELRITYLHSPNLILLGQFFLEKVWKLIKQQTYLELPGMYRGRERGQAESS